MKALAPLRYVLAQMAYFLPLILMALMALASFLLYQFAPSSTQPLLFAINSTEPDYFFENFSARQYDEIGQLRNEIFGASALHFPDSDQLKIEKIQLKRTNEVGQVMVATAATAWSNRDYSKVELTGNAKITLSPKADAVNQEPTTFFSEHLRVLSDQKILVSDMPVIVRRGKDQFSSTSMQYDDEAKVLDLKGKVSMTLHPR